MKRFYFTVYGYYYLCIDFVLSCSGGGADRYEPYDHNGFKELPKRVPTSPGSRREGGGWLAGTHKWMSEKNAIFTSIGITKKLHQDHASIKSPIAGIKDKNSFIFSLIF